MESTFSDVLTSFSDVLSENLISPINLDNLLKTTALFPHFISPGIAFETLLTDKTPALDMFLSIEADQKQNTAEFFSGSGPKQNWSNIRQFYEKWSDPNSPVYKFVNRLFLEFDGGGKLSNPLVPAVFFQIDETAYGTSDSAPDTGVKKSFLQNTQWIFDSLEILNGSDIHEDTKASIIKCYDYLPPGSYIDHVAVMPARIPEVIRLNVNNLSEEKLYPYLSNIGLVNQILNMKPTLKDCWPLIDHIVLALDIDKEILPRIGIEFRLPKNSLNFASQKKWYKFLDYLEGQRLCSTKKKQGLIEWVGKNKGLTFSGTHKFDLYRYIHFFKAVFQKNETAHFKGYFTAVILPQ